MKIKLIGFKKIITKKGNNLVILHCSYLEDGTTGEVVTTFFVDPRITANVVLKVGTVYEFAFDMRGFIISIN